MKTLPTQPAFPVTLSENQKYSGQSITDGLTKREYFAAMALQGILANSVFTTSVSDMIEAGKVKEDDGKHCLATMALEVADALIEQLNEQP